MQHYVARVREKRENQEQESWYTDSDFNNDMRKVEGSYFVTPYVYISQS